MRDRDGGHSLKNVHTGLTRGWWRLLRSNDAARVRGRGAGGGATKEDEPAPTIATYEVALRFRKSSMKKLGLRLT